MYRILPETGEILVPHVFEDGRFGVADPANGKKRHHIGLKVPVDTIEELREYLRRGWPIWMSIRGTRDRRLISNGIVDAPPPDGPAAPVPRDDAPAARAPRARAAAAPAPEETPAFLAPEAEAGELARKYLPVIASMTEAEAERECASPSRLLMSSTDIRGKKVDVAYAPFDHVNRDARVVIVGITPGRQQMELAVKAARDALASGASREEALARAKVHASFGGQMRKNLVKMLDAVGVNSWLGVETTASLWGEDAGLAHFTSAIRYPVFVEGGNYTGSNPRLGRTPQLFSMSAKWLAEEIEALPEALFVPLGDVVDEVLAEVGRRRGLGSDRILTGLPHAAGSNNGPISWFLGKNGEKDPWRVRFHRLKATVEALPPLSAPRP